MAKQARQKKELGKGLKSLLGGMEMDISNNEEVVKELSNTIAMIPIRHVQRNPEQPRKNFDENALNDLASSIKTYGLIQPITVRHISEGHYQIISGERRTKASQIAGLTEIPAYIRLANDQVMMEMALVENIQRENLNPMEIANTYQRLIEEFGLTHDKLSERVGKKRSTVTNYLNLRKLPPSIQKGLTDEKFSTGHAKAIKGIESEKLQQGLYKLTLKEGISVRELERLVKAVKGIEAKELRTFLDYKIEDLDLSAEDLTMFISSLQKIDNGLLSAQLFERVSDTEDAFSVKDLADMVNFLESIDDKELKDLLYSEIQVERTSILHLAAFAEKYLAKKAKAANKGEKISKAKTPRLSTAYQAQENFLKTHFEAPVKLKLKENGKGEISIPFDNVDDFNAILDKIKGEA
ncbi:MAG: ParB/RepB/Spo0J family partition protein [Bacteroidota bacterium]